MMIHEMVEMFLDSRVRGVSGAKCQCTAKTLKIYRDNMRVFETWFMTEAGEGGVLKYEDIKRMDMIKFNAWLDEKEKTGVWAKASKLQVLRTLRTFFRWIVKDEDCVDIEGTHLVGRQNWLPAIPKNPRRMDIPQLKDLKSFKNTFNTSSPFGHRDYVAVCLMMDTGVRLGEVCNLRLDHLKIEECIMYVDGKQGPRHVAFTKEMGRLFRGWLKKRTLCAKAKDSPYVFVSKYGPQMDVNAWGMKFRRHCKKHGLPRITAHTFRHSFCTNYLRKGGDIEKLRLMTGHTTYEMLREYLHLAQLGSKEVQIELERVSLLKDV